MSIELLEKRKAYYFIKINRREYKVQLVLYVCMCVKSHKNLMQIIVKVWRV